jgi:glycosyltransferase involved in cell wall biosynthesis
MGLPIVATDVGGVREAVGNGENGYLLPRDAGEEAWAHVLLDLIADRPKRERFGRRSRARAKSEFSFGILRERVEAAFAKLA